MKNNLPGVQEYVELKDRMRLMQEQLDVLSKKIMGSMEAEGLKTLTTTFGTLSEAERVSYTYPKRVEKMREALKAEEKKTIATGKAKVKAVTKYLILNRPTV